jgi:small-conductance mechanosensitive channel
MPCNVQSTSRVALGRGDAACSCDINDRSSARFGAADPQSVIERLRERITIIPNVLAEPAPDIAILSFTLAGPVLAVSPCRENENYWQVYFDANMVIREVCGDEVFPPPMLPYAIKSVA